MAKFTVNNVSDAVEKLVGLNFHYPEFSTHTTVTFDGTSRERQELNFHNLGFSIIADAYYTSEGDEVVILDYVGSDARMMTGKEYYIWKRDTLAWEEEEEEAEVRYQEDLARG